MATFKRVLVLLTVGGLVGGLCASWIGPKWISFWFTPPVQNNLLTCTREIDWAMSSLVTSQIVAGLAFAVGFAVVGSLIARAWKTRAARKAAAQGGGAPGPAAQA